MEKNKPIVLQSGVNLVDGVEQALLDYIVENKLAVGDSIPYENELSELTGASRHVVREALSRLKSRGIVVGKKHCGMRLAEPCIGSELDKAVVPQLLSVKTLVDLLELRITLEQSIVPMILARITDADIADLKRILDAKGTDDVVQSVDFEQEFHSRIYSITGNAVMVNIMKVLLPVFRYIHDNVSDFRKFNDGIKNSGPQGSHDDIVQAIESRDPARLALMMKLHLSSYVMYAEEFRRKNA